eukprot:g535.t1
MLVCTLVAATTSATATVRAGVAVERVTVHPPPAQQFFGIVFPRNGSSVSVPEAGLELLFDVRGFEAEQRASGPLYVCMEEACLRYPFEQQPFLARPGENKYVLHARLVDAAGLVLGYAVTQFWTTAKGVVYSPPRRRTGWVGQDTPHLDLAALRAPGPALRAGLRRLAHLVHDTEYERTRGFEPDANASRLSGPAPHRTSMTAPAGHEPYHLLASLALQLRGSTIVDLGSHFGVSAFALAAHPSNTVLSYDVVAREPVIAGYNNMSVAELRTAAPTVHFRTGSALRELRTLAAAPLISLDTAHWPFSQPFERELLQALDGVGYDGVVVCDDIHMNAEMVRWWHTIPQRKFDVTAVGHGRSGTGIVDFGGKLSVSGAKVYLSESEIEDL